MTNIKKSEQCRYCEGENQQHSWQTLGSYLLFDKSIWLVCSFCYHDEEKDWKLAVRNGELIKKTKDKDRCSSCFEKGDWIIKNQLFCEECKNEWAGKFEIRRAQNNQWISRTR